MVCTLDCSIIDAVVVLQKVADVTSDAISIRVIVIAATADQDTDIIAEVISERTLDALISSLGLAHSGEIGHCGPERRILLEASFALEGVTGEARSAISSVWIVVLA